MDRDNQSAEEERISGRISRRHLLALSSGAIAGLAGCSTQENKPTSIPDTDQTADVSTDDNNQSGGTPVTTSISSHFPAWDPSKTNFNPWSPPGNEPPYSAMLWYENLLYRNNKGQICHFLIDEVEFNKNGCEVLFHFNENYQWWDGTSVTAEDWAVKRKIKQYQTYGSPSKAPAQVSVVDDYTLKESRAAPVNPTVRKLSLTDPLSTRADYYREWVDKYEDASSKDQRDKVTTELTQHKISMEKFVNEGLGCGLWKPKTWNPTRVTYEKFDGHARSDWTNLDTWKWELVSGDQKFDQAFQNDRFDMGELNFNLVSKNPNVENVAEFPLPGVPKLTMNFSNKHLARRGVRRAIAYAIDYDQIRQVLKTNYGTPYADHPYVCGMASAVAENWLGQDFLDKFIDYGSSAQLEKAKQAMQSEGYSKQGDTWVGPDGDAIEGLKYITPPWSIYQSIEKFVSAQLNDFGIKNKALRPSRSNFYKRLNETYEFDLLNWYHFGFHPVNTYYNGTGSAVGLDNYVPAVKHEESSSSSNCQIDRSTPELELQRSPRLSHPIRPEFPKEVGAKEVNGNGQTLYPVKWTTIMNQSQDRGEIVELAKKLAWYYNWQVPHIGFYEEVWNYWAHTQQYTFRNNHPETETKVTAREHTIPNEDAMQMKGHVSAKTK